MHFPQPCGGFIAFEMTTVGVVPFLESSIILALSTSNANENKNHLMQEN
jgi:preprotein translocase subunit SecY